MERLTADQLASLKAWGDGLTDDAREEIRAAGRAIQMLVQEIEALHIEFWHDRIAAPADEIPPEPVEPSPSAEGGTLPVDSFYKALRARLSGNPAPSDPAPPQA